MINLRTNNICGRPLSLPRISIDRHGNPYNEPIRAAMEFKFIDIYLGKYLSSYIIGNVKHKTYLRYTVCNGKDLTERAAKLRLTDDQLTLNLFMKAINVTNSSASAVLANTNWNKNDVRYDLDLAALLPDKLSKRNNAKWAHDFLAIQNYDEAVEPLCNIGALSRFADKK